MPTYTEMYQTALCCNTPSEASLWLFRAGAEYVRKFPTINEAEARKIILHDLRYMTKHYGDESSKKIKNLFRAEGL